MTKGKESAFPSRSAAAAGRGIGAPLGLVRRVMLLAALGAAGAGMLAGCGFRPLYARNQGPASTDLARVEVARIADRMGQQLRIRLQDNLDPTGGTPKAYTLAVELRTDTYPTVIRTDETSSRNNYEVTAVYVLRDKSDGKVLTEGQSRAVTSYNTLFSDYATTSAEADARNRLVGQIAAELQTRLAIWFDRAPKPAS